MLVTVLYCTTVPVRQGVLPVLVWRGRVRVGAAGPGSHVPRGQLVPGCVDIVDYYVDI